MSRSGMRKSWKYDKKGGRQKPPFLYAKNMFALRDFDRYDFFNRDMPDMSHHNDSVYCWQAGAPPFGCSLRRDATYVRHILHSHACFLCPFSDVLSGFCDIYCWHFFPPPSVIMRSVLLRVGFEPTNCVL